MKEILKEAHGGLAKRNSESTDDCVKRRMRLVPELGKEGIGVSKCNPRS